MKAIKNNKIRKYEQMNMKVIYLKLKVIYQ